MVVSTKDGDKILYFQTQVNQRITLSLSLQHGLKPNILEILSSESDLKGKGSKNYNATFYKL